MNRIPYLEIRTGIGRCIQPFSGSLYGENRRQQREPEAPHYCGSPGSATRLDLVESPGSSVFSNPQPASGASSPPSGLDLAGVGATPQPSAGKTALGHRPYKAS